MRNRAARRVLADEDAAAWDDDSTPIAEMPAARPADAPPMDGAPLAIRQNEMSGEVPGDQPTEQQNPEVSLPLPLPPMPAPAFPAIGVLDMALDASRISTTLINATIDYRLLMANTGATRLDTIVIEADMVGAHASLPVEAQLASEGLSLPERHRIDHLAPDQAITLTGSIRLPLADIRAIRQGPAALFVPLVRLRIFARDGDRLLRMARTWVVGEGETADGAGLRPFRLDLGPRVYPVVDQRQL